MSIIEDGGYIATIDSYPSEELTSIAYTIMTRTIEEPGLAKQLEPYEWYVLVVDNDKRETGRASQTFNPPDEYEIDSDTWAAARNMMLQCRDIAAVAKLSPHLRAIAIGMVHELFGVLAKGEPDGA